MGLGVGLLLGYAWAPVACSGKSSSSLYFLFSFLFLNTVFQFKFESCLYLAGSL
jgi:hypothetical protein